MTPLCKVEMALACISTRAGGHGGVDERQRVFAAQRLDGCGGWPAASRLRGAVASAPSPSGTCPSCSLLLPSLCPYRGRPAPPGAAPAPIIPAWPPGRGRPAPGSRPRRIENSLDRAGRACDTRGVGPPGRRKPSAGPGGVQAAPDEFRVGGVGVHDGRVVVERRHLHFPAIRAIGEQPLLLQPSPRMTLSGHGEDRRQRQPASAAARPRAHWRRTRG